MSDLTRMELHGALEGHHVSIDEDQITFGVLEDLESGSFARSKAALAQIIAESDLPKGHDAEGIRALTRKQSKALFEGVAEYIQVSKS